jgi:hypothetical protein
MNINELAAQESIAQQGQCDLNLAWKHTFETPPPPSPPPACIDIDPVPVDELHHIFIVEDVVTNQAIFLCQYNAVVGPAGRLG